MENAAYRVYADEASDWLKTARTELLRDLVERNRPPRSLELLEIGAGVGQNLSCLARFGAVDALEISPLGQDAIRRAGVARELFGAGIPTDLPRAYDVICALDVVEHIEDDVGAVEWIAEHLRPGGIFVATVPAYPWLFSDHDRALHHFRRYSRDDFCRLLPESMEVVSASYFNHFLFPLAVASRGIWSLRRVVLGGENDAKQRSPQNGALVTVLGGILDLELRLMRRGYRPPYGLSVCCVARRR